MVRAAFALCFTCGVAHADPYPEAEVDRPLLRPSGMTALDIGIDLVTYRFLETQADGTTKAVDTGFGANRELDVAVTHGFEGFEIFGRTTGYADNYVFEGDVSVYVGPGAVFASVVAYVPYLDSTIHYEYDETIGYTYKRALVPGLVAIAGGASAGPSEISYKGGGSGTRFGGAVNGLGIVQLLPRLSLQAGLNVDFPLGHSAAISPYATTLNLSSQLQLVLGHWDLYAQFFVDDVTKVAIPSGAVGFVHRWGNGD